MCASNAAVPHLEIRLLGELEVLADGVKLALPQSKKTRALLGYLLLSGQEHRRDRLCSLLWDVVDDPRAALRWSLSKLRETVDAPALKRLCSDREHVSIDRTGLYVDALEVPRLLGVSVQNTAPQALAAARSLFRGELLEGIELADFHGFSAWLLAERTRFRELHRRVLNELIEHSGGHPERVLPLIRDLVHIDPTDEAARAKLLEVLHATGAIGEAHEQARANQRLMAPVARPPSAATKPAPSRANQSDPPQPRRSVAAHDDHNPAAVSGNSAPPHPLATLRGRESAPPPQANLHAEASLSGREHATAPNAEASLSGREHATAANAEASLSGREHATAPNAEASLSGREHATAPNAEASLSGRKHATATHAETTLSGREHATAPNAEASLSGRKHATATHVETPLSGREHATATHAETTLSGREHATATHAETPLSGRETSRHTDAPLIGREHELAAVQAWLSAHAPKLKAWLFEGEAGMGKSRLLRECERLAVRAGARAVRVRVPDARPGWPYAALQALLAQLERGEKDPLQQLVEATATSAPSSREELLQAVQGVLERATQAHARLVLLLDDVHHLDDASVELVHFCALNLRALPIAFVLSARGGELHDRPSIARTLRALRREHILEELQLSALTLAQTQSLLGPAITPDAAQALYEQSGGNPLFALLLREQHTAHNLPRSIAQLVQDRIAGLLAEQADVLRWAAVLGAAFHIDLLRQLVALDEQVLVEALEGLERHGWLSLQGDDHARFVHQIVQRALYDQLSEPRKRLMHSKVAQLLAARSSEPARQGATTELTALLAHHAVAGGDRALAVRACLAAGQRCLRVYAHADAYSLARRGLAQAGHLPEPDQTCLALELLQMQMRARWPESLDDLLPELVRLTERALDLGAVGHAHLGFHLRAYIKWQAGDPADAQRYSREVERISRMTAPHERAEALADSARCLAQLERDLSDAEAFVNEAELLADPDHPPAGLPLARGMLTLFRGDNAQAEADLERARQIAARAGNRLEEFYALEYCVYLELARERYSVAQALCADLTSTAERLREGSELAFARALAALVRVLAGADTSFHHFAEHYETLAAQDAKQRCAYLAAEAAHYQLAHGDHAAAVSDAQRALTLARAVDRPTECALALSVIVRAELASQSETLPDNRAALCAYLERPVSALARSRAEHALALSATSSSEQEKPHGARNRRTRVRGTSAG